jgi:hypothetical protein
MNKGLIAVKHISICGIQKTLVRNTLGIDRKREPESENLPSKASFMSLI